VTSTKTRALDAAIDLVGTQGLRALTHTRVDERAGLPRGSTSNYFRTRQALLSGVASRLLELDMQAAGAAFMPASGEEFVEGLCRLFDHMTRVNPIPSTARLVLFMEGSHNSSLREDLSRGREALESVVVVALARLGAHDPATAATTVAACFEGLLLHRIARHDETDPRPAFELVVRAALV
jgi:DNA-binding transcriptional regulator YbjK